LHDGFMDGLVLEHGSDNFDGLAELLSDEIFDGNSRVSARLTGGCRQEAGWRICFR
jgi:hypothetical protein